MQNAYFNLKALMKWLKCYFLRSKQLFYTYNKIFCIKKGFFIFPVIQIPLCFYLCFNFYWQILEASHSTTCLPLILPFSKAFLIYFWWDKLIELYDELQCIINLCNLANSFKLHFKYNLLYFHVYVKYFLGSNDNF